MAGNQSTKRQGSEQEKDYDTSERQSRGSENSSEAAEKMRRGNPEERSEGARELGKQSHKNE